MDKKKKSTFKKFIRYYKPYRKIFYFDLFCAAVISVIDIAYPQLLKVLSNTLFMEDSQKILKVIPLVALAMAAAYTIQALCKYYVNCQGHVMGAEMEKDMRAELFEHYEKLSFSYYDKNNTGSMMSRLISDLFDISEVAHHGPENLFISAIKAIGSFIFLFIINWQLSLALLVVGIAMFFFAYNRNKYMRAVFRENRKRISEINAVLQDSFSGIRIVQAFGNEDAEQAKFDKSNEEFMKTKRHSYHIMGTFFSGNGLFVGLMYLATICLGGVLIAYGKMTATDLAMFSLYIGIFISPIMILVELTESIQRGMSGFTRFLEVIETEPEVVDRENAQEIKNPMGNIEFKNVGFFYNEGEDVLKDVNFTVQSGKSIALVGPSGGGKTTICSLIPRFYDITDGSITIDGQDIRDITLKSLRKAIGIVQQDVYLFSGSIYDNIAYGRPDATKEEIIEAAKKANIHNFIMTMPDGYDTLCGERGVRLSGGQKQRISIARVFLKNPPILILDEATSALDNESERYIQKSLDDLSKNRTTITIAHRLSTIKNADEILVIGDNGIQERGSHSELLEKGGIYTRYFELSR